jgi:transcriptional regulator with XRE-family HTH domain
MEEKGVTRTIGLGFEIRKLLKAKGVTKKELAAKMGMGQAAFGSMIDKPDINTKRLRQLSDVLGENLFALFLHEKPVSEQKLTEEIEAQKKLLDEKDRKIADLEKEIKLLREMLDVIKALGRGK